MIQPSLSVRNRLFFSFGGAAIFTVLASALGIFAFVQSRAALDHITQSRLPLAATAHQIAQQTEAIAATAPSLLSSKVRTQRLTAATRITDQMIYLGELVARLESSGVQAVSEIARKKSLLYENFKKLDKLVQARIEVANEKQATVLKILATSRELHDATVKALTDLGGATPAPKFGSTQHILEMAHDFATATLNNLLAAANTKNPFELQRFATEFQKISQRTETLLGFLPEEIAGRIREPFQTLTRFGIGPRSLFRLRENELKSTSEAERMVLAYNQNGKALVFAANVLIEAAQADISAATEKSRANLRTYGILLAAIAASCVLGAILLAVYIGRDIGERLTSLQKSMAIHAAGGRDDIPLGGNDEIGHMAGALKTFISTINQREDELRQARDALKQKVVEIERSKDDLRRAKEEAELSNRSKSEFLANMSHELRTPLNAIIGFSDLTLSESFGPVGNARYVDYAKDINQSGQHLLQLINDILDLSKIEAGKLELYECPIDLQRTISACLVLIKDRAESGGLTLKSQIPKDLPSLYADDLKVKQIVLNLLSNAVKFTPPGGRVTLSVEADLTKGLTLQVSDTGIGIAAKSLPLIFAPFVQEESTLSRTYEGTGLGLPLTKALVEIHGGHIAMESEVGLGTTVTLNFPAERIGGRAHSVA